MFNMSDSHLNEDVYHMRVPVLRGTQQSSGTLVVLLVGPGRRRLVGQQFLADHVMTVPRRQVERQAAAVVEYAQRRFVVQK